MVLAFAERLDFAPLLPGHGDRQRPELLNVITRPVTQLEQASVLDVNFGIDVAHELVQTSAVFTTRRCVLARVTLVLGQVRFISE